MQVLGPQASLRRRAVPRHVRGDRDGGPRGAVGLRPDRPRPDQRPGRPRSRPRLRWALPGRRGGAASDAHPPRPRRRRRHDRAATAGLPGLRARAWRAPHGVAREAHRQRDADLWRPDGAALGRVRGGARGQPARAAWRRADRRRPGTTWRSPTHPGTPSTTSAISTARRESPSWATPAGCRTARDADGDAADPAARHRRRRLARQRRADPRMAARGTVPDAFRPGDGRRRAPGRTAGPPGGDAATREAAPGRRRACPRRSGRPASSRNSAASSGSSCPRWSCGASNSVSRSRMCWGGSRARCEKRERAQCRMPDVEGRPATSTAVDAQCPDVAWRSRGAPRLFVRRRRFTHVDAPTFRSARRRPSDRVDCRHRCAISPSCRPPPACWPS